MTTITAPRPNTTMGQALAERALLLETRRAAHQRRAGEISMIDLVSPGVVNLPTHVRDAAKEALDRGETHYTVRPGIPELRGAIAETLERDGYSATVDRTVVTNGGAEALYILLQALLDAESTVAIPSIVDPSLIEMVDFIGASIVRLDDTADDRFLISAEDVASIDADTLVLASPSPVSGAALSNRALADVINAALDRGINVVLDQTLSGCRYDPNNQSFLDKEAAEQIFLVGSFSTSHGLRGWQVGYFVAPENRLNELRGLKQAMSICTTAVSQFAALAALQGPTTWIDERRKVLNERRNQVISQLLDDGLTVLAPDAYPSLLIDIRAIDLDDVAVAENLAFDSGVLVEPGSLFGEAARGFVRLNLDADSAGLKAGITRIAAGLWGMSND